MEDRCNFAILPCSANHAICYYDIYHKSNENADKTKNQRAAAVVLITWFNEPCTVCNDCIIVTVMWCTFATRQHKDSSINFA